MYGKILSIVLAVSVLWISPAQAFADQIDIAKLKELVENRWDNDEPGGGVIILQKGEIVFEAYKGLRDLSTAQPITKDTIFPYASNTKRMTATAILSLYEDNKIDLEASIATYLPEIEDPISDITVRNLLTHSSGIPRNFEADFDKEYSTADHIEQISALSLEFEPGTRSAYSNNGYNLLGAIIERITGQPWHVAMHQEIIKPTGLSSIHYLQNHIDQGAQLATGYWEKLNAYPPAPVKSPTLLHANGAMAGTLSDLAYWTHQFHNAEIIT